MSKPECETGKKTGPASFEEVHGEPAAGFRFKLTQSQHAHLRRRALEEHTSMAEILRRLIDADRPQ